MKTKICLICKNLFFQTSNNQKYCSLKCKTKIRKEQKKIYDKIFHKKYYENHKNKYIIYREQTKQHKKEYDKEYKKTHKNKRNKYEIMKRNENIRYKLLGNLRSRIRLALKRNSKRGHSLELLGCSIEELKKYLASKFTKNMSWSNYGKWHIDHIIPCASFDLSKVSEQKKCFNYINLQPLWAKENLKKHHKVEAKMSVLTKSNVKDEVKNLNKNSLSLTFKLKEI
jgi:hypothetical protein